MIRKKKVMIYHAVQCFDLLGETSYFEVDVSSPHLVLELANREAVDIMAYHLPKLDFDRLFVPEFYFNDIGDTENPLWCYSNSVDLKFSKGRSFNRQFKFENKKIKHTILRHSKCNKKTPGTFYGIEVRIVDEDGYMVCTKINGEAKSFELGDDGEIVFVDACDGLAFETLEELVDSFGGSAEFVEMMDEVALISDEKPIVAYREDGVKIRTENIEVALNISF